MRKDPEKLYFELLTDKNYHLKTVEIKFKKLNVDTSKYNLFQVKSAIIYLSRFENEIDSIINEANNDLLSILNAATVKEERG
ncbi:hypothetical protein [Tenacibaculum salmonis]|uniref:hypothetical protein n=1 Tax=Tenacibaculum sp. P3-BQ1 TaxID=3232310 RepID=UPI0034DE5485